jgi:hypothetical protein
MFDGSELLSHGLDRFVMSKLIGGGIVKMLRDAGDFFVSSCFCGDKIQAV